MARLNAVKSARESKRSRACGRCSKKIRKGDSYFWWKNRAPGQRNGVMNIRCADHRPTIAEMTPGRRGQLYQLQEDIEKEVQAWTASDATETDSLQAIAEQAAEGVRELAEELREGAQNIEDGFGHETSQSAEMAEKADELDSVADELESPDLPEPPEEPDGDEPDRDAFESDEEWSTAVDEWTTERDSYEEELATWRDAAGQVIVDRLDEAEV